MGITEQERRQAISDIDSNKKKVTSPQLVEQRRALIGICGGCDNLILEKVRGGKGRIELGCSAGYSPQGLHAELSFEKRSCQWFKPSQK